MSFEKPGGAVPAEQQCQYGRSKLICRGPRRHLTGPYNAFLGGCETFGKYVHRPFAALVERETGQVCANLGSAHAGIDAYLQDDDLMQIASGADRVVIQATGAQNLSNPWYRVHPRRNDRFIQPTAQLVQGFNGLDFTQINFTKHLIKKLHRTDPDRFADVVASLKVCWTEGMTRLIRRLGRPPVLLWLRYIEEGSTTEGPTCNPMLVDREMIDGLRPMLHEVAEVRVERAGHRSGPTEAAEHLIGQAAHYQVAEALLAVLAPDRDDKRPA